MGSGMSQIVEGLYLGNIRDSEDKENLEKHGITHILSVHNNAKPGLEDMTYLCISASDSSSQNLTDVGMQLTFLTTHFENPYSVNSIDSPVTYNAESLKSVLSPRLSWKEIRLEHFKECIRFVHECRLHGGRCLIHCLAGVSRSTTLLVAYLMTVTNFGWEECLAAVKTIRSYVSPNFGFQQQLQDYEKTLLKEYRAWIRQEYGRIPFNDQEELQRLLSQQEEKAKEQQSGHRETNWINAPSPSGPLSHNAYAGSSSSRWANR